MKVRLNYVSNSSSSSYIIGVAVIGKKDIDDVASFLRDQCGMYYELVEGSGDRVESTAFDYNSVGLRVETGDVAVVFSEFKDADSDEFGNVIEDADTYYFSGFEKFSASCSQFFKEIETAVGSGYNG